MRCGHGELGRLDDAMWGRCAGGGVYAEFGGNLLNKNAHGINIKDALAQVGRNAEAGFGGARSYKGTLFCCEAHGERDDAVGGRLQLIGSFGRGEGGLLLGSGGVCRCGRAAVGRRLRLAGLALAAWGLWEIYGFARGQDEVGADLAPGVAGVESAGVGDLADSVGLGRIGGTRGGPGGILDHDGVNLFNGPAVGGLDAGVVHHSRFPDGARICEVREFPAEDRSGVVRGFPFRRVWRAGSGMGRMLARRGRYWLRCGGIAGCGAVAAGVTL